MNDVVTKERLRSRFDLVHADHVERLWRRLKHGFDQLLESMDYKVHWQCQEIVFPFKKLEEARLIHLLSEYDDPSEGNDYLFLAINDIVDHYNTFIRHLSELELSNDQALSDVCIHPKFVVSGNGGASRVCAVPVLSRSQLKNLVESGWDDSKGSFDTDLLRKLLHYQLFLDGLPPTIMNPTSYLRETFLFREETIASTSCLPLSGDVSRSAKGDFFANSQDFLLFSDVSQLLVRFELPEGNGDLNRTFNDHFYGFNYVQLRSSLEGVRNLLQMLRTAGTTRIQGIDEALCGAMRLSKEEISSQGNFVLSQIGFPDLAISQYQLILSLDDAQIVDFVDFIGHQLATEAYVFASLPLCMTEPLSEPDRVTIVARLKDLYNGEGLVKAEERLEEFVRDVLSFYEREISKMALSTGQQLRAFLTKSNFCDESDAIFAFLPHGVTVRNYIALRQLLHQTRLEMRFNDEIATDTEADGVAERNSVEKAVCWFWNDEDDSGNGDAETESPHESRFAGSLWFEQPAAVNLVDVNARKIQRWWRHVVTMPKNRFQGFGPDDDMDWEAAFFDGEDLSRLPTMDIDVAEDGTGRDSVSSWTYESLYLGKADRTSHGGGSVPRPQLYGSVKDEAQLRRWLNDHKLTQSMGDFLISVGVRDIDDVAIFVEGSSPDDLKEIPRLDLMKLNQAIQLYREESKQEVATHD
jgi:hypothetical protein